MKSALIRILFATCLFGSLQSGFSQTLLLSDNFTVSTNSLDPNSEIETGRQDGTMAISQYTRINASTFGTQVGNGTNVGQPGGASESNYLLLSNAAVRLN